MADLITIKKWTGTSPATPSGTQYVILKDDDFGLPQQLKRIYAVYITYKTYSGSGTIAMNAAISYDTDGGSTFITTYIHATALPEATAWDVAAIEFSTVIQCQSFRLRCNMEYINDITVEYRPIYKRVS